MLVVALGFLFAISSALRYILQNEQCPVHAYVAVPGGKTCYLSELKAGKEVILVDQKGHQRTAIVGRVQIETRPLILVEAEVCINYKPTVTVCHLK